MIEVVDLERRFGDVVAIDRLTFKVAEGELFGFLGPNGAGKSTTLKILCTLLRPSGGRASVAGHDVVRAPSAVRQALGVVFQDPAIDDRLTGRENLEVHARVYGVPRRERAGRIAEALAWIELEAHAEALVRTFSGGMRRRLEVARALVHRPRVLFLDEPTTGLDPQTRRQLWDKLAELRRRERVTIFMTTHYLDEAEACDRIAIIDDGRLLSEGTPGELRRQAGADRIALTTADDLHALAALEQFGAKAMRTERGIELEVESGEAFLPRLVGFPVEIRSMMLRKPTLEDAFIALTGHGIRPEEGTAKDRLRRLVQTRRRP